MLRSGAIKVWLSMDAVFSYCSHLFVDVSEVNKLVRRLELKTSPCFLH